MLASPVTSFAVTTASVFLRVTSPTMLWDPRKDAIFDKPVKDHMLQHSEEALPVYVPPPSGYTAPEDGCEEIELDRNAAASFGRMVTKANAWVCADGEGEAAHPDWECNYVMHKGEVVQACVEKKG